MGLVFSYVWSKPVRRMFVVGLDSSGTTSLVDRLNMREFVHTVPTVGFNTE